MNGNNALFTKAVEAQRQGKLELAMTQCSALVEQCPDHARGWALRAILELGLQSSEECEERAVNAGERAFTLRPDLAMTRQALVQALTRLDSRRRPRSCTRLLERAVQVMPHDAGLQFRLGRAARQLHDADLAKRAFRATLQLDPEHERAKFWLATLDNSVIATEAPRSHVKALYEDYAPRYDDHLENKLHSRAPMLVANVLRDHCVMRPAFGVDVGCGTGLSGAALVDALPAVRWTGIDLSPAMSALASRRGVYESVIAADMLDALDGSISFDLIACCDVLVYFGDLAPFFRAAATAAKLVASMALSLEDHIDHSADWKLTTSGRFTHAVPYVVRVAGLAGWICVHAETAVLRTQGGLPVHGRLYVFHREHSDHKLAASSSISPKCAEPHSLKRSASPASSSSSVPSASSPSLAEPPLDGP